MFRKTKKKIERVAIFGDGEAIQGQVHFDLARKTAKLLAEAGYITINGGGPGVMLAATLGAKEGKGKVELSIVKKEKQPKNYEGSSILNLKLADKVYEMSNYENRMNKLVEISDAYVIFKGGTGTLAEVGLVWSKAKFAFGNHEPLIFVGKEWENIIPVIVKDLKLETIEKEVYTLVETPEEVLKALAKAGN
jgi:uncharacterized protein (TIGR00725 family)